MSPLTRYEYICHPLFLVVTGGLNFPPVVFGVLGYKDWCNYYSNWLVGNAALTGLHIIAALYCVYKIRKSAKPYLLEDDFAAEEEEDVEKISSDTDTHSNDEVATETTAPSERQDAARQSVPGCFSRLIHLKTISSDRIRHMICYDGIITTYAIMFLVWVVWMSEGAQRVRQEDLADEEDFDGCLELHDRYMTASLVCGFGYFSFVLIACLASLC